MGKPRRMTPKAIAANKANATRSTGPKVSRLTRFNAVKHGVLSKELRFRDDAEAADFNARVNALIRELLPNGSVELTLIEDIAICDLKLRRLNALEPAEFEARRQASRAILENARADADGLTPFEVPPEAALRGWDCAELVVHSDKTSSMQDRGFGQLPSATSQVRFVARFSPSFETLLRYAATVRRDRYRALQVLCALQGGRI